MTRDDGKVTAAKRSYRNAKEEGNRKEEARWANMIGHIFKNRGEYVEALKWLRLDYEVSNKYLPEKQLLPTCQSLGELHLRLEHFQDALKYQKQHLELAKDSGDLVEQQRASTQLGRTYYEIFLRSQDDHNSKRNAKKYFKLSLSLAQTLKEKPPSNTSSFLKEYIDAHNNIGMLEMELDNLEEAEKWLTKGLTICDEEEVIKDDDGRSRLHHNLGCVYTELRMWDKARKHIEKDITICNRIGHCQGEAKGFINLGELHYRVQKYEDAIRCYQKALNLAKSMEDEDALVDQIDQNIETVKEAMKVMDDLKKEEQVLKKLTRSMEAARGTPGERKCLLLVNASLDRLIEKSSITFAWLKHREFAKRKKRVASELCDKEKLGDAYLVIGESYQKLRNFSKALKWYKKSREIYKSIGNLEGEALAKINIGDVLDGDGKWRGALDAFEEGYRIAVKANLPLVQLSALENMHYSNMIRFDNAEEARRLQLLIDELKLSKGLDNETNKEEGEACSETDTEGEDMPNSRHGIYSPKISKSSSCRSQHSNSMEELKDDVPLISFLSKSSPKLKTVCSEKLEACSNLGEVSPESMSKSTSYQKKSFSRKRVRIVLSEDEDEVDDRTGTSDEFKNRNGPATPICNHQAASVRNPANLEESSCSYKSRSPKAATPSRKFCKALSMDEVAFASDGVASGSRCDSGASESRLSKYDVASPKLHTFDQNNRCITFNIENDLIQVEASSFAADGKLNIESMKVEVACLYYLRLPMEKRLKGLLPIIQHVKCGGRTLESSQTLKDDLQNSVIEVDISGWVQKRLMKMYIDCCKELCEAPNLKLLKKLYNLEVSDDEIVVSDCELQDISIAPLLSALHTHKTIATLNFSHNLLGNGTMEKIQQIFSSSSQKCGSLTLDLHCNRFGPTALFQICECPILLARLEVLNISGNRLTDASGSYLSTILENCKGLYNLNIERCSLTSRTIQKVADALHAGCVLSQLSIGYNNLASGNAITNLLGKLTTLERFSELNLNGLKLSKPVVASLCQFAKTLCLSGLMLGGTGIGTDGASQLTDSLFSETHELVKLDLSCCGLTSEYIFKLNTDIASVCSIIELNLGGNPILHEASNVLVSLLRNPQCCLKILVLDNCKLGLAGVLHIIQALSENNSLEELNLAKNADPDPEKSYLQYGSTATMSLELPQPDLNTSSKVCDPQEVGDAEQDVNSSCNQLEVADSEDEMMNGEDAAHEVDNSSASTWQRSSSSVECQFIQELSTAVAMAKHLQLLDISDNGFSTQAAEKLYNAWMLSGSRAGSALKHIEDQTIHFSVEGSKCYGLKPCCRRD